MVGLKTLRVVIVGGGPAAAAVAIMLSRRGLKPLVLEALSEPARKIGECLPPGANAILEMLGIKDRLREQGHLPSYGNRSVWGSSSPLERDFLFGTHGHGWHLDRRRFEEGLASLACEQGAEWRYGCRVVGCGLRGGKRILSVKTPHGNDEVEADFVVDATGRPARVARQFGAKQFRYDRLVGVAVLMKSESGKQTKDTFTLVEAVATGWWYSAPLPQDGLIAIYMSDTDLIDHATVLQKKGWYGLLEEAEHTRQRVVVGGYFPLTEPQILPANSARLDIITGERWLAVGDAAVSYDPLSSYGISSAMGCGLHAADAIVEELSGNPKSLLVYRDIVAQAYRQYMSMHCRHYALERRWTSKPFWRRRHSVMFGKEAIKAG